MCPVCLTTVALVAAGSVSTGGLAALFVKTSRERKGKRKNVANPNPNERRIPDVKEHN